MKSNFIVIFTGKCAFLSMFSAVEKLTTTKSRRRSCLSPRARQLFVSFPAFVSFTTLPTC